MYIHLEDHDIKMARYKRELDHLTSIKYELEEYLKDIGFISYSIYAKNNPFLKNTVQSPSLRQSTEVKLQGDFIYSETTIDKNYTLKADYIIQKYEGKDNIILNLKYINHKQGYNPNDTSFAFIIESDTMKGVIDKTLYSLRDNDKLASMRPKLRKYIINKILEDI